MILSLYAFFLYPCRLSGLVGNQHRLLFINSAEVVSPSLKKKQKFYSGSRSEMHEKVSTVSRIQPLVDELRGLNMHRDKKSYLHSSSKARAGER